MRPLELRLRNFRSYFDQETVFDFRGRRLVGIVGPIGSGKSTILDAIAFALYGRTPTVAKGTKALIHQRADAAHIALRFEVDGQVWEAVRVLRAKGQSAHALYRLADDTAEARQLEKITLEAEMNQRIRRLLGMEFDAFGRSVMLAQGRFAEFLIAPPRDRDKVLKGVFGHDRVDAMRAVAKDRVQASAVTLAALDERARHVQAATTRAAQLATELRSLEERLEQLRKAEPALRDLDERASALGLTIAEAEKLLSALEGLGTKLPSPADSEAVLDAAEQAAAVVTDAAASLETARARLVEAAERAALLEPVRAEVAEATKIVAALEPRRQAAEEAARRLTAAKEARVTTADAVAQADTEVRASEEAAQALAAAEADAAQAAARAEAAFHEAQHADFARALRGGLQPGDPCPVCAQEIAQLPADAGGDVAAAKSALERARAAHREAGTAHAAAVARLERSAAALVAAREAAATVAAQEESASTADAMAAKELQSLEARARDVLGEGSLEAALRRRVEHIEQTDAAVVATQKEVDTAADDLRRAERAAAEAQKAHSALRLALAGVATHLDVDAGSDDDAPAATRRWLDAVRRSWNEASTAGRHTFEQATNERAETMEERAAVVAPLDLEESFSVDLHRAEAAVDRLAAELERLRAEIEDAAGIGAEREEVAATKARYERLVADLTDTRFVRFLLEEQRFVLADLGSAHFATLSAGRYQFTESFEVVDLTAADAVRKSDSLSGGETFLASLALAIALAEMVARTGGRLDAFFLDEGFGSLDAEHLDLAMDGIEALVAGGTDRFVAVVSHVPEMMHRLEDLLVLDRDPTTGDTRVVRA